MCGIIGGFALNREAAATLAGNAQAMLQSLAHRGRDGSGLLRLRFEAGKGFRRSDGSGTAAANALLGHTRLAIIDTSDAGLQPMASADGRAWITFNGEIYNFVELRRELEGLGHRFHTATDTEVLLACYREYGPACLARLNGMFAFAIFDGDTGRVFMARDPLGIKPLYYRLDGELLLFASEIKGILASGLQAKDIDWQAAYHYFTYLYAPHPLTFFKGIRQLPPGHCLEIDPASGRHDLRRYWHPRPRPEIAGMDDREIDGMLVESLSAAVARQMRSDVPIGSFLSGGVDSTIVTGLMTRHSSKVKTYTVTFPESQYRYYNEGGIARETARHLGTEHHDLPIRLDEPGLIFSLLDHFDQPYGNLTYYLMYLISREARRHITVALCGAGGDELFAGYPRHRALRYGALFRHLPAFVPQACASAVRLLPDRFRNARRRRVESFFAGIDRDPVRQYLNWTYFLTDEEKGDLLAFPSGAAPESSADRFRRLYGESLLADEGNRFLELDVHSFLVDNLLEYTDKMSMAVPIELRVPLLDHEFVELALNVPFARKLRGGESKIPLRRAFKEFFTPAAQSAPKKGFNVPLAQWMRDSLDGYFDGASRLPFIAESGVVAGASWEAGLLRRETIDRYRAEHRSGARDRSYELFSIMVFDYWFGRNFA